MTTALLLYSGGLDSLLAGKVLQEQGIKIIALNCILPFVSPDEDLNSLESSKFAIDAGFKLIHHRLGLNFINMTINPAHGYGKNMNPCVDCKIHFIGLAKKYMIEMNADFVATGEVVGQRPMSQLKHTINHIANETSLEGKLLRPLSAKILKPTLPEMEGIVDREQLLGLSGRGRKQQILLTEKFGIKKYESPSGGCLFTDINISKRIKDLYTHHSDIDTLDLYLLTIGRNFRLNKTAKLIVSKNEEENVCLDKYINQASFYFIPEFAGPNAYVKGNINKAEIEFAASIIARYGKIEKGEPVIKIYKYGEKYLDYEISETANDTEIEKIRI